MAIAAERRKYRRYDLSLEVQVKPRKQTAVKTFTRDISARGIYFDFAERIDPGSELEFELNLPPELRRKFEKLKLALAAPPPADSAKAAELTKIAVSMESDYGRGTWCRPKRDGSGEECLQINELSRILAESQDPEELAAVWEGWHAIGAPMKDRYARFVELSNEGARQLVHIVVEHGDRDRDSRIRLAEVDPHLEPPDRRRSFDHDA